MKKLFVLMCAAVALSVSCTKENQIESASGKEVTLTAYTEEATKTSLVSNGSKMSVQWNSNDAISLFYHYGENGGNKFVTSNPGSVATFTGTISAISGSLEEIEGSTYFWGVFPYNENASCDGTSVTTSLSAEQNVITGNVNRDLLVTVGRSKNLSMYFQNTLAVVELTIDTDDIASVTFSGNNGEYIAGEYNISINNEGKVVNTPTENAVQSIKITPSETSVFAPYATYCFAFIPSTFSKGYTLTFRKTDGSIAIYSTSNSIEFNKAFYTMTCKDQGLVFDFPKVDLGLSVMWSTYNLGAYEPWEPGWFYQWGSPDGFGTDLSDDMHFDWQTYPLGEGSQSSLTKYCWDSTYGVEDYLSQLQSADDAVYLTYGEKWHIPTDANWGELMNSNNCTWTWTTIGDMQGYKVQSKKAGYTDNWIFLPAAGYRNDYSLYSYGTEGDYWTANLYGGPPKFADYVTMDSEKYSKDYASRSFGLSLRPVKDKK